MLYVYFFLRRLFAAVRFGGWAAFLGRVFRLVSGRSSSSSSLLFDAGSSFAAFAAASDSFESEFPLLTSSSELFCLSSPSFSSELSFELECDPSVPDSSDDEWFVVELFDWLADDAFAFWTATVFDIFSFFDWWLRCDALLEFDELDEPLLEDDDDPSESLILYKIKIKINLVSPIYLQIITCNEHCVHLTLPVASGWWTFTVATISIRLETFFKFLEYKKKFKKFRKQAIFQEKQQIILPNH